MRELFQFLAGRSISAPGAEITEYEIAARVFGRGEDFDPSESNVVRVAVRQLRSKLKEYFEEAGAGEKWIVEFPKGGYELHFISRSESTSLPSANRTGEFRWKRIAAALGVLVVLLAAALLWTASHPRVDARSNPSAFLPRIIQTFGGPVQVIAADSAYVLIRHFGAIPLDVEDYESGRYTRLVKPEELPPRTRDLWQALQTRQYLNIADVNIAYRLAAELYPDPPLLRMAKHLRARDFRAGNYVILGSGSSNPWHLLFRDQLNFYYECEPARPVHIRNRNPRP
ncbi:MAG: winged helix-turn-helix domain-containing protein, partial [Bryobacteraceae bacterium]|nr:winged helix-turn-helix domain-containing protein [Bryobacteraceae bacterium]